MFHRLVARRPRQESCVNPSSILRLPWAGAPSRLNRAGARPAGWPKVHLIYFVLAAIDIAAISVSLAIGFHLMSTFERGTDRNLSFDAQATHQLTFLAAASDMQQTVIVKLNRPAAMTITAADLRVKADNFRHAVAAYRGELNRVLSGTAALRLKPALDRLDSSFTAFELQAKAAMEALGSGRTATAWDLVGRMQQRYLTLQFQARDVIAKVNFQRKSANQADLAALTAMQRYEFAIAAVLVLIIGSVIAYGHFVGALMKRKYAEVSEANEKLAGSNDAIRAEAVRTEEANRRIEALNAELKDNLAALREAQDEAVKRGKLAQLGQLTATVAHELRNPLGAVRTSAFLLEKRVKGKNLGVEPQIERINNGVSRCDNIISQLLDFARSRSISPEPVAIDDWLAKLIEDEAQRLPASIEVDCRLGIGSAEVGCDPARMARVVINLVNNAAEALVDRNGDTALKGQKPRITISTSLTHRGAEITVADNGPGIAPEVLERIFEPLFTTKNFGTGLGLPAIQKVMEQHRGGLEVSSAPGKGASFTAWWPDNMQLKEAC